ncbi:MAG: hypothetical protein ACR2O3_01625 [Rhizobiaceae bacterium]
MKFNVPVLALCMILALPVMAAEKVSGSETASCSPVEGISKCEVICVRELGKQCLVTHVNFEGSGLKSGAELWTARFLTCRKADLDLQLKSVSLETKIPVKTDVTGIVSARAVSTTGVTGTPEGGVDVAAALSRIPFDEFLNSGESHVEASMKLLRCGSGAEDNLCNISGKLVAVTDPNIRCNFHDVTGSGAFRPASLQISPLITNSQQPVGRIGE